MLLGKVKKEGRFRFGNMPSRKAVVVPTVVPAVVSPVVPAVVSPVVPVAVSPVVPAVVSPVASAVVLPVSPSPQLGDKDFDKSVRPLLARRNLMWGATGLVGVYDDDFRRFLLAKDEVIPTEGPLAALSEKYSALARHLLVAPQLKYLRKMPLGPIPDPFGDVFRPVLAVFGGLYLAALTEGTVAKRPAAEWEALLAARAEELRAATASSLSSFVSPFKALVGAGRDEEPPRKQPRFESGSTLLRRGSVCDLCGKLGHIARYCRVGPPHLVKKEEVVRPA